MILFALEAEYDSWGKAKWTIKMAYEHVNSIVKKLPSSLFLFHSCICFVSDAATNSPLNVLLKRNNCNVNCYVFILYWYIYVFIYITESFLMKLNFRSNIKRLCLFLSYFMKHWLSSQTAQDHCFFFSHIATELGLDWWTNKTGSSLKSCWRNRCRVWPAHTSLQ